MPDELPEPRRFSRAHLGVVAVVLVLGLLGLIIGRIIDGQLDVHDIFGKPSQRNR